MKKMLMTTSMVGAALALAFTLGGCSCSQEESGPSGQTEPETVEWMVEVASPEDAVLGMWYGTAGGVDVTLELAADGTYRLASALAEPTTGTWEYADGRVFLGGYDVMPLRVAGEVLFWPSAETILLRDELFEAYAPADVVAAELDGFAGYWKCVYVDVDGTPVRAAVAGSDTFVYVEGNRVALGGSVFGNAICDFVYGDDALVFGGDGLSVTLELQEDSLMRLTATASDETLTLYLLSCSAPFGEQS